MSKDNLIFIVLTFFFFFLEGRVDSEKERDMSFLVKKTECHQEPGLWADAM